jgi:hypothetical protein
MAGELKAVCLYHTRTQRDLSLCIESSPHVHRLAAHRVTLSEMELDGDCGGDFRHQSFLCALRVSTMSQGWTANGRHEANRARSSVDRVVSGLHGVWKSTLLLHTKQSHAPSGGATLQYSFLQVSGRCEVHVCFDV